MAYEGVPEVHPDEMEHRRILARTVNNLILGRVNSAALVTLVANETQTVLTREEIGPLSVPVLSPMNEAAALALAAGKVWATCIAGALTIHHDAIPDTRNFAVAYFG